MLLPVSAWTPGAAGVGMASRYLSEHWMPLQPAYGGTACPPASALQWAAPAALLPCHARPNLCRHLQHTSWCDQAVTLVCPSRHHTLWTHRRPIGCHSTTSSWDLRYGTIGPGGPLQLEAVPLLWVTTPHRIAPHRGTLFLLAVPETILEALSEHGCWVYNLRDQPSKA